jgi:hypothetical protein
MTAEEMENEWYDCCQGKAKALGEKLTYFHYIHHKPHIDCPGIEFQPPQQETSY